MSCPPKLLKYVKIIHVPNEGWEASALYSLSTIIWEGVVGVEGRISRCRPTLFL